MHQSKQDQSIEYMYSQAERARELRDRPEINLMVSCLFDDNYDESDKEFCAALQLETAAEIILRRLAEIDPCVLSRYVAGNGD